MTDRKARTRMLRSALGLGTALALSALGMTAAAAQEKIKLEVWSWQVIYKDNYEKIFKIFEAKHPNIDVEFRGFINNDYPTVLKTGLSGDRGPDLAMLHPYRAIAPYALAGQLKAIDKTTVPELANFTPDAVGAATLDGKIWGVPFATQALQVFYNVDIFKKLGIEEPKKASEVAPMIKKIKDAGLVPYAATGNAGWQLVNIFDILVGNTYGGKDFLAKAVTGEVRYDSPAMVKALQLYDALEADFPRFVSGVGHPDARALFVSGRAAMFPGGAWELALIRKNAPDMNLGVFSMPADESGGPAPTWGYEDGSIAISARTKHPKEALELLRWMGSQEFGQAFTEELRQLSSVKGVTPSDPVLAEIASNFQANPVPMVWVTHYFGTAAPAPFTTLGVLLANLMVNATDPATAAKQLELDAREFTKLNQ
jgi:raffinose/stachyose/melibiose transport system substrate-binding protein